MPDNDDHALKGELKRQFLLAQVQEEIDREQRQQGAEAQRTDEERELGEYRKLQDEEIQPQHNYPQPTIDGEYGEKLGGRTWRSHEERQALAKQRAGVAPEPEPRTDREPEAQAGGAGRPPPGSEAGLAAPEPGGERGLTEAFNQAADVEARRAALLQQLDADIEREALNDTFNRVAQSRENATDEARRAAMLQQLDADIEREALSAAFNQAAREPAAIPVQQEIEPAVAPEPEQGLTPTFNEQARGRDDGYELER